MCCTYDTNDIFGMKFEKLVVEGCLLFIVVEGRLFIVYCCKKKKKFPPHTERDDAAREDVQCTVYT